MSQDRTKATEDIGTLGLKKIDRQHRFKATERFAHVMSRLTNPIFLALFYFLIFTPFSLCYRVFSSQSFRRKEKNAKSSWVAPSSAEPISLENQF